MGFYPGEDGYWVAQCPSLPPFISQGKTKTEAIANIQKALEINLEVSSGNPEENKA
ncbi:MAG: type II toxin-antitoxin system HicB family antitoxin [Snowella sp.]